MNPSIKNVPERTGLLSAPEQYDFDLIIANARSSGWIDSLQCLTAERSTRTIVVRSKLAEAEREHSYSDDPRWVYALLHDLAHGLWRQ